MKIYIIMVIGCCLAFLSGCSSISFLGDCSSNADLGLRVGDQMEALFDGQSDPYVQVVYPAELTRYPTDPHQPSMPDSDE